MLAIALLFVCVLTAAAEETIDRIVAVVDNEIILESEVYQYLQFNYGSVVDLTKLPPEQVDSLEQVIIEELIDQKVLLTYAREDTSVRVLPREVDRELDRRMEALIKQVGGQDNLESYYGMPLAKIKRQFRPMVEDGLLIEKVRQQKLASVKVTRGEVIEFWNVYKDSIPPLRDGVRIAHILLADQLSDASVAAAVARADSARAQILRGDYSFESYATQFSEDPGSAASEGKLGTTNRGDLVPEFEAAAYQLKEGELSQPVVSSFGVHVIKLNSRTGEKINTSHILFKIVPAPEDEAITQARADSIASAARAGADFAALALKHSIDSKTAPNGGDLGWFSPADLPVDFRTPVEGLQKGEVADPIRTQFGVHVLKVTDRVFSRSITFEEDYNRIEQMALVKKQDEQFPAWLEELSAETYIDRKAKISEN